MKEKISRKPRTSNSNYKVEVRSRRSAKRSSVLRNANDGWSRSTASNLKRTTDVWGYALRAHTASN